MDGKGDPARLPFLSLPQDGRRQRVIFLKIKRGMKREEKGEGRATASWTGGCVPGSLVRWILEREAGRGHGEDHCPAERPSPSQRRRRRCRKVAVARKSNDWAPVASLPSLPCGAGAPLCVGGGWHVGYYGARSRFFLNMVTIGPCRPRRAGRIATKNEVCRASPPTLFVCCAGRAQTCNGVKPYEAKNHAATAMPGPAPAAHSFDFPPTKIRKP